MTQSRLFWAILWPSSWGVTRDFCTLKMARFISWQRLTCTCTSGTATTLPWIEAPSRVSCRAWSKRPKRRSPQKVAEKSAISLRCSNERRISRSTLNSSLTSNACQKCAALQSTGARTWTSCSGRQLWKQSSRRSPMKYKLTRRWSATSTFIGRLNTKATVFSSRSSPDSTRKKTPF